MLPEIDTDPFRERLNKYTVLAFQMLPKLECPRILDIGCGSGVPTIVLANLIDGEIIGIDTNQRLLDRFKNKVEKLGLSNRVFIKNCSLFDMDFPDESFDVIWAEGSVNVIGFEKALKDWRFLLKSGGFLVVHDGVKTIATKLNKLPDFGFVLVNHFVLPENVWIDYFERLQRQINEWRKNAKSPESLNLIERYQNDVNLFKKNPKENVSGFYLFQKT